MIRPADLSPDVLNEAYRVWDKASGQRTKILVEYLKKNDIRVEVGALEEEFYSVTGTGYVFLDKYASGAGDTAKLWEDHAAAIRQAHPWLDDDNFGRACHQSSYDAWHDGLPRNT